MYSHHYFVAYDRVQINHMRESKQDSGLIVPVHIGACIAKIPRSSTGPLHLPLPSEIIRFGSKADDQPGHVNISRSEDILCANIGEFKAKGVELLKSLSGKLGGLINLSLELTAAEDVVPVNSSSQAGSSEVHEEKVFKHFLARPEEIEAMEQLSKTSVAPPEAPTSSQQDFPSNIYL